MPDILKTNPKTKYFETRFDCNAEEFRKVVESRRSVRIYTEEKIPEEVTRECLRLALLAPNSSNLQPWAFYWVKDVEKKKALAKACMGQMAAKTAAELIVCVAEPYRWKEHCELQIQTMKEMGLNVPKIVADYYLKLAPLMYTQGPFSLFGAIKKLFFWITGFWSVTPREPMSHADMNLWASKTVALACENLMLAFVAHNFDTCPMEGFDSAKVKKILGLKCKDKVVMIISAGRRHNEGVYGPRIRFDSKRFIREV